MKRYTINSKEVGKKEFFQTLRADCVKVVSVTVLPSDMSAAVLDSDPQKYARVQRSLRAGHMVLILEAGRTYASYPA